MSDSKENLKAVFRIRDEKPKPESGEAPDKLNVAERVKNSARSGAEIVKHGAEKVKSGTDMAVRKVDKFLTDETGEEAYNYTGDEMSERDYRPIRRSHEPHTGCLGGIMYFAFVMCVSIVLACLAWMCASDMLALNKENFTATVNLPMEIFKSETVDTYDEQGNKTGTERVTTADMSYVADKLHEAGLIEYKWLFEFFCDISNADKKVSPGEYELLSRYDYRALIQNMRAGASGALTVDVTIPEGFTMEQIFRRLEEYGVCTYDELMEAAANYSFNYKFLEGTEEMGAVRLEGYLFPDTYQFYVDMEASSAINKFLEGFYKKFTNDMIFQTENMGMTVKEIVTVASLIEREAANDNERALIASVIYNRLNTYMPLGIDASILYLHQDHEGAPTAEMIAEDTPYNTRIHTGLTPTPIANPGLASIQAALNPEKTNYYYYALDTATGDHRFFNGSYEHSAFVATQNYE